VLWKARHSAGERPDGQAASYHALAQAMRELRSVKMRSQTLFEKAFDQATILAIWRKGRVIDGFDPSIWRWDTCGSVMRYSEYGQETTYGWEIDHIYPKARGGSDDMSNQQPLYWENNRRKGDSYPWSCS
jgi:hypothetical protein